MISSKFPEKFLGLEILEHACKQACGCCESVFCPCESVLWICELSELCTVWQMMCFVHKILVCFSQLSKSYHFIQLMLTLFVINICEFHQPANVAKLYVVRKLLYTFVLLQNI